MFRKSSNDSQENPKDAQGREEALKKVQEENTTLNQDKNDLARERDKLADQNKTLIETNQKLTAEKRELNNKITGLATEKDNLTTEKEKLNTDLSNAKSQVIQANQEKEKLERKHAPYQKLEKLYEVFLEVKGCLNFNFVATTHSAMDLIASVLSDSKYY